MTDKLKQAAHHLLKVLDEICADDYIQEVIDAHLEKYGDYYRSERVTRCRDEKLSYLSAVAELEAALAAPQAQPVKSCATCKHDLPDVGDTCFTCKHNTKDNWEPK